MNNQIKSLIVIIGLILLSNWGAGIIVKNKEVKIRTEFARSINIQKPNEFLCDTFNFKKNRLLDKKR